MNEELKRVLARVSETCDFDGVDLTSINATSPDGDNALHVIARDGNLAAAKVLIEAGIDVNKAGDLGYTPLHVACMNGDREMVQLLIARGADLFALSEGEPPLTSARVAGHDDICELLGSLMTEAQLRDPKARLKSRIVQLQREIADLKAQLAEDI